MILTEKGLFRDQELLYCRLLLQKRPRFQLRLNSEVRRPLVVEIYR